MTDSTTKPDSTEPDATEPASKPKDPTGVEGANPALDDTGDLKAAEVGEAPEPPENLEDLDLTPEGLSDEPAQQEDADTPVKPENS
ncbi:hypothetical protein [Arthrobacter oryzae]|jgi:hypothetical protein|uniref:hypothetical protein n=1 Tax=Arthrobacter oryzae TaxID=409290 RepID=UPI002788D573|nr:hypothetical protein [Arthrobacter oryzae]MDQ0078432.1 hypothetical protein [Arthrobacter oryzae]